MKIKTTVALLGCCGLLLSACQTPNTIKYRTPDTYLVGQDIEKVATVFGNPEKSNTIAKTLFVTYIKTGSSGTYFDGRSFTGYTNFCYLALQADTQTNLIKKVDLLSNMAQSDINDLDISQDCSRLFYIADLASTPKVEKQ